MLLLPVLAALLRCRFAALPPLCRFTACRLRWWAGGRHVIEGLLGDFAASPAGSGWGIAILRYFNPVQPCRPPALLRLRRRVLLPSAFCLLPSAFCSWP